MGEWEAVIRELMGILAYLCMTAAKKSSTTFLFEKPAGITCPAGGGNREHACREVCSLWFYVREHRGSNVWVCSAFTRQGSWQSILNRADYFHLRQVKTQHFLLKMSFLSWTRCGMRSLFLSPCYELGQEFPRVTRVPKFFFLSCYHCAAE